MPQLDWINIELQARELHSMLLEVKDNKLKEKTLRTYGEVIHWVGLIDEVVFDVEMPNFQRLDSIFVELALVKLRAYMVQVKKTMPREGNSPAMRLLDENWDASYDKKSPQSVVDIFDNRKGIKVSKTSVRKFMLQRRSEKLDDSIN